jgi:hypothetical protein
VEDRPRAIASPACRRRLDQIRVGRDGPGRPRKRPDRVVADKGLLRCFNRLKQFRGLATRYAERAAYYCAEIVTDAAVLWRRTDLQGTAYPQSSFILSLWKSFDFRATYGYQRPLRSSKSNSIHETTAVIV